jgi:dTDP-4-dehydrorhamnose 3,5-epimerase-like enzyme
MNFGLIDFSVKVDERGSLVSLEEGSEIPFKIKRVYYIFDTKHNVRRGFHAHKNLSQVLICIRGSCKIMLDDGNYKEEFLLSSPSRGLLIKGLIWREMFDFSSDCVLMVLADNFYNEDDYIRNHKDFLNLVASK